MWVLFRFLIPAAASNASGSVLYSVNGLLERPLVHVLLFI